jgi:hypothetical protein
MRFSIRYAFFVAVLLVGFAAGAQEPDSPAKDSRTRALDVIQIPAGTILPVRLKHGLSSKKARAGEIIACRIMQDVPLANPQKLPEGTKILGRILAVAPAGAGGGSITLRFDRVEVRHQKAAIVSDLRAIASFMEVEFAQTPETTLGFGTPYPWATTDLIGGDIKYGVGGPVTDRASEVVGEGTVSGVLVHVAAGRGTPCRGELDSERRLQAMWVFSADSCGVYGLSGLRIAHAGRSAPVGEITFTAESGEVKVPGGSGMLLRGIQ